MNPAATKEEMVEELLSFGAHCCLVMGREAAEAAGYEHGVPCPQLTGTVALQALDPEAEPGRLLPSFPA